MSTIHFIRHGQASFGSDNYDRLSETGYLQSKVIGDWYARLGVAFDAVYSGPLSRQQETALTAMARLPGGPEFEVISELSEYDTRNVFTSQLPEVIKEEPGVADLLDKMFKDRRTFQIIFEKVMRRWVSGKYDADGCETWLDFKDRVQAGIRRIMAENGRGKTVAVFSSGGPLSLIMQLSLGLSDEKSVQVNWQAFNASISEFFYSNDRISISSFNSTAHLREKKNPALITYR